VTADIPVHAASGLSGDEPPPDPRGAAREPEAPPDYVDLGAMILDAEEPAVSTRMIEEDEHTEPGEGFGSVLSRFRARLTRNLASGDSRSHQDMGTGYRAMGLGPEAIGEFQQAIRQDPASTGAYEMLGRCFLDAGQPELAANVLARALELTPRAEDEFLGIYYYMGRAQEASGNPGAAFDFYRKTIAMNIDFQDVAARFRDLGQVLARLPEESEDRGRSDSPGTGSPASGRAS
jgi:lipoprotein NlpI